MINYYAIHNQSSMEIKKTAVLVFLMVKHQLPNVQVRFLPHIQLWTVHFRYFLNERHPLGFFSFQRLLFLLNLRRVQQVVEMNLIVLGRNAFSPFLNLHNPHSHRVFFGQHSDGGQFLCKDVPVCLHIFCYWVKILSAVVLMSQVSDDGDEVVIFLLHLLMVASTLLSLPGSDEGLHSFEDLVHASHVAIHKVFVVYLQKPMIFFVFLQQPMTPVHVLILIKRIPSAPPALQRSGRRLLIGWLIGGWCLDLGEVGQQG